MSAGRARDEERIKRLFRGWDWVSVWHDPHRDCYQARVMVRTERVEWLRNTDALLVNELCIAPRQRRIVGRYRMGAWRR